MAAKLLILCFFAVFCFSACSKNNPSQPDEGDSKEKQTSYKSSDNQLLIGVCYYPWYRKDAHWSGDNLRYNLVPAQQPVLGKYDCMEQSVISKHVEWSVQAGVDFWISSWWGPGSSEDDVILQGHQKNPDFEKNMAYCILYEPQRGIPIYVEDNYIRKFLSDLDYLSKNHFSSPNYLKIDNKPVLYIYLTRTMSGNIKKLFETSDSLLQKNGYDGLYVVGDEAYWGQFSESRLNYMEAVTAYNPHVSQSWVSDPAKFISQTVAELYEPWMNIVNSKSKSLWIDVLPGFNDLGVRKAMQHPVIPRNNTDTFSNFLNSVSKTLKKQNSPLKVLVVTSWNEWHEDSQIEPTVESAEPTQKPFDLTMGFWYQGYNTRYLDVLAEFKKNF